MHVGAQVGAGGSPGQGLGRDRARHGRGRPVSKAPRVHVPAEGPLQGRMVSEPPHVALAHCLGPVQVGASLSGGPLEVHVGASARLGRDRAHHGRGWSMWRALRREVKVGASPRGFLCCLWSRCMSGPGPVLVGAGPITVRLGLSRGRRLSRSPTAAGPAEGPLQGRMVSEPPHVALAHCLEPVQVGSSLSGGTVEVHVGASARLGRDRARHGRGRPVLKAPRVHVPAEEPLQGRMVSEPPCVALAHCLGPVQVGSSLSGFLVKMHVGAGGGPGGGLGWGSAHHGRGRSVSRSLCRDV